jgi:hypothetical protein
MDERDSARISPSARGWAVFFSVILGLVMLFVLLVATMQFTLLNPSFVEKAIEKSQLYDALPRLIAESIKGNIDINAQVGDAGNAAAIMTTDQLVELFGLILPGDYIKNQAENNIEAVYEFTNLQTTDLSIAVDMKPIINRLASSEGMSVLLTFINNQPECTEEQFQMLTDFFDAKITSQNVIFCRPPIGKMDAGMKPLIDNTQAMVNALPAELVLFQDETQITQLTSSMPYQIYRVFRANMKYVYWVAGSLALLIMLLTLRSGRMMFACLGIPLLVSGLIGSLTSALTIYGGNVALRSVTSTDNVFGPYIVKIIGEVMQKFSSFGLFLCGATLIFGLVLLLISRIFKK